MLSFGQTHLFARPFDDPFECLAQRFAEYREKIGKDSHTTVRLSDVYFVCLAQATAYPVLSIPFSLDQ
jgi:hypothetical protein